MTKSKALVFLLVFVFLLAAPLLAIQDSLTPADEELLEFLGLKKEAVAAILNTVFGLGLFGLIQFVKGLLSKVTKNWSGLVKDIYGWGVTILCSAGATYFTLSQLGMWSLKNFLMYGIYAVGVATGAWKGIKQLARPPA